MMVYDEFLIRNRDHALELLGSKPYLEFWWVGRAIHLSGEIGIYHRRFYYDGSIRSVKDGSSLVRKGTDPWYYKEEIRPAFSNYWAAYAYFHNKVKP